MSRGTLATTLIILLMLTAAWVMSKKEDTPKDWAGNIILSSSYALVLWLLYMSFTGQLDGVRSLQGRFETAFWLLRSAANDLVRVLPL